MAENIKMNTLETFSWLIMLLLPGIAGNAQTPSKFVFAAQHPPAGINTRVDANDIYSVTEKRFWF